jgi:hypothetical protein
MKLIIDYRKGFVFYPIKKTGEYLCLSNGEVVNTVSREWIDAHCRDWGGGTVVMISTDRFHVIMEKLARMTYDGKDVIMKHEDGYPEILLPAEAISKV